MNLPAEVDAVVVGGGFFGASVAVHLRQRGMTVLLVEREPALMQRASFRNQARVHAGYHYPRSLVTALRSLVNYPRFLAEFQEAVVAGFEKVYPIARHGSKVSARQFAQFCKRIGAPLKKAPPTLARLFNGHVIEEVYSVTECAFDSSKLAETMLRKLQAAQVELAFGANARRIVGDRERTALEVEEADGVVKAVRARWIFNCTYSHLNELNAASGLALTPLRHELTEIALVEPPAELANVGVTVMCGPYFSTMPFPARGLHSLSHVRYTPHFTWSDVPGVPYVPAQERFREYPKRSSYPYMQADAARYLPCMNRARYVDSLWEVKTVLPLNEGDDGRPIFFKRHPELPALVQVMGGKVDNIFDINEELDLLLDAAR